MKRIRRRSKSGFTLLEVMLAVVILVIASTMIMKGFIAVMIMGKNNSLYSKSGAENYRQAMSDTLAHYATAANQQNDVINELYDNGNSTVLSASFGDGHVPNNLEAEALNITVDVTAYINDQVPVFSAAAGTTYVIPGDTDAVDASTTTNNRFAFFYDFGDYIGMNPSAENHCVPRWGYTIATAPVSGHEGSCVAQDDGTYRVYGWYCFNNTHVGEPAVGEDNKLHYPDLCGHTQTPFSYGVLSNPTIPEEEEEEG